MTREELIQAISEMSVLELPSSLRNSKRSSASAPRLRDDDAHGRHARSRAAPRLRGGREDRVRRSPRRPRREQDQRHQGRPRDHRPRPEGSQGHGRRRPKTVKEGVAEGRGRRDEEEARRGRSEGRTEVVLPTQTYKSASRPGRAFSSLRAAVRAPFCGYNIKMLRARGAP